MSNIKFVKVDIDESKIVKNVPLTKGEAAAIANFILGDLSIEYTK